MSRYYNECQRLDSESMFVDHRVAGGVSLFLIPCSIFVMFIDLLCMIFALLVLVFILT